MASGPAGDLVSLVGQSRPFASFVGLIERLERERVGALPVLTYHRVDAATTSTALYPGLISATPAEFEEQIRFLAWNRRAISMAELLDIRHGRGRLPPGAVLVTFDDAYRDFAEHGWPTLRRYGIPVTLFVPTAYPGHPQKSFWWDRLYQALSWSGQRAVDPIDTPVGRLQLSTDRQRTRTFRRLKEHLKSLPHEQAMASVERLATQLEAPDPVHAVLDWSELRRLAREGVTLAPHSRTHPLLDRVSAEKLREEIEGSIADLEREIGEVPLVFAFPSGAYDTTVLEALRAAGVRLAFTTRRGSNDLEGPDWLRLRRINVGGRSSLGLVRAQLLPSLARVPGWVSRPRAPSSQTTEGPLSS